MTDQNNKLPGWFMPVAIIAFIWNLMGVAAFIMQMIMTPEDLAKLPPEEAMLYANIPVWATIAFAVAVFGGALGSFLLIVKNSLATTLLTISLTGVLVQMYHSFFIIDSIEVYGPGGTIMPILVIVIALLLLWMASSANKKGWLA